MDHARRVIIRLMRALRREIEDALESSAIGFLAIVVWPGLARYAYAPGFSSALGVARTITIWTALYFVVFHRRPYAIARQQRWDATWADCAERLGRRPTPDEFWTSWKRAQADWKVAGRPV